MRLDDLGRLPASNSRIGHIPWLSPKPVCWSPALVAAYGRPHHPNRKDVLPTVRETDFKAPELRCDFVFNQADRHDPPTKEVQVPLLSSYAEGVRSRARGSLEQMLPAQLFLFSVGNCDCTTCWGSSPGSRGALCRWKHVAGRITGVGRSVGLTMK